MKRPWIKGKRRRVLKGRTLPAPRPGTKRALVLAELRNGECDAGQLARAAGASLNGIVHTLNTLTEKGLIKRRAIGTRRYLYTLATARRGRGL